jgi:hypothetical protein
LITYIVNDLKKSNFIHSELINRRDIVFILGIILIVLMLMFILMGVQFRRGKWLRLIAGNTFGDLAEETAIKIGRQTGIVMYLAAVMCLFFAWWLMFSNNQVLFWSGIGILLIGSGILLVSSLRRWMKHGN